MPINEFLTFREDNSRGENSGSSEEEKSEPEESGGDSGNQSEQSGTEESGSQESAEKGSEKDKEIKKEKVVDVDVKEIKRKTKDEKKQKPELTVPLMGKLFKKGASGRKNVALRDMKLEGSTLSYYKSEALLQSGKGGKTIVLKGATIEKAKEVKNQFWIDITLNKKKREIATKTKEDADKWVTALKAAAAEKEEKEVANIEDNKLVTKEIRKEKETDSANSEKEDDSNPDEEGDSGTGDKSGSEEDNSD